jgi:hypothetical protein
MIDRDSVNQYNIKPKKDREHEVEEKEEMNLYNTDNQASRTPLGWDTPMVKVGGGASVYGATGKSSYYGGKSPSFRTPIYNYSQREFSERQMDDLPANSPLPSQTPLIFNQGTTPLIGNIATMSPLYNPGQTPYNQSSLNRQSSQMRSPSYLYQASSSPNYSSLRSHSPDYNSPMGSSGRYSNSPNYSPSPMDQHRSQFKNEENDSDEEDE